ncbi:DUF397 domain-containing protein [Nocardiopsis sp. NPDC058789]|uniref:DUF397 domain-containing protein n=1 Tax=Nocardiopsis sp. NPDC058789 TaxID=3346634 RepID=UPI003671D92E
MTDPVFRKSSYSGAGENCVEVADLHRGTALRDSQNPTNGNLPFPIAEWTAFLHSAREQH